MSGQRLGGSARVPGITSLPFVVLEWGDPDPPGYYYNLWRVIDGQPVRLTEFTYNSGTMPQLDNQRLSPDGNWISCGVNFFDDNPFGSGIITVPSLSTTPNGGEEMTFDDDAGGGDWTLHLNWHPDSDQMIFTYGPDVPGEGGFAGSIYHVERTSPGAAPTEIWRPATTAVPQREGAFRPTYSPDGSQIAFIVNVETGGGGWDYTRQGLWVCDADGSNDVQIGAWSDPSDNNVYMFRGSQIAWSPDGEWIAFRPAGFGASEDFSLYKIRPDGTDELLLAEGHPLENSVAWQIDNTAWAADQDSIIATVNGGIYGAGWGIYRVEADGSGVTELLDGLDVQSPFGSNYFRQVYRNHLTGRLEWISSVAFPASIITTSLIDATSRQDIFDVAADSPTDPGYPIGDRFYGGDGYDWL